MSPPHNTHTSRKGEGNGHSEGSLGAKSFVHPASVASPRKDDRPPSGHIQGARGVPWVSCGSVPFLQDKAHQGDQTGNHPRDLPPAGLCPGSTRIQNGLYTSYTYIRSHPQAPCPPHPLHASHPPYNAHISRACQPCPLPNVTCCQRNRSGGI